MKNNIPFVGGWAQWPKPHLITHRGVVVIVDTFSLAHGVVWWSSRSWLTCEVLTLGAGGGCCLTRDVWWRVVVEWLWSKCEVLLLLLTGGGGVCRSMCVWEVVEGVENVALTVWTDLELLLLPCCQSGRHPPLPQTHHPLAPPSSLNAHPLGRDTGMGNTVIIWSRVCSGTGLGWSYCIHTHGFTGIIYISIYYVCNYQFVEL